MKNLANNVLNILFNKITFFTILSQWMLIAAALYQRGYWQWNGHFVSDPALFQGVVLLNFPAITVAVIFLLPPSASAANSLQDAVIFLIVITLQWWIVGCAIEQIFFNDKYNEISK